MKPYNLLPRFISIVLIFIILSKVTSAQTVILNAESGRRNIDAALCWDFKNVNYTNHEFRISGNWSLRVNSQTTNADHNLVKSPWIKPGSGNLTMKARLENSAGTARGITFSYIAYNPNAPNSNQNKEGVITSFFTYNFPTPLNVSVNNISFPIPPAIANTGIPYKILINFFGLGGSSNGSSRVFADDIVIPGSYSSDPSNRCLPLANIIDADADGVANVDDAYPNDVSRAFNSYYPTADTYGTLMYEDLWPSLGDNDFNDLVLSYRYNTVTNAANKLVELKLTYIIKAIGAAKKNGFAVQLDGLSALKIAEVTGTKTSNANWLSRASNGVENGQNFANIIIYDNVNKFMVAPGNALINTVVGGVFVIPDTANVTITFKGGLNAITASDISLNPYLIVNQDRAKEIHLPNYLPTNKATSSYNGTKDDNTNPATGVYYKSKNNIPWALNMPTSVPYVQENNDFLDGYYHFSKWATSNGNSYKNWYLNEPGYRNKNKLY